MADERARNLRKNMTDVERRLWQCLRLRQLESGQQAEARAYDSRRDDFMHGHGCRILRFWNNEVLGNMDGVWQVIVAEINNDSSCGGTPHPDLPPQGGKGLAEQR